ncbi:YggS family pyridoxal phosphate-dependent enzyme [Pseudoflavitalea sp. G-6-1-2]|uniref:YggS family pyridoxal phosphate-dependent enzyme n=1 Tax=Pseudoflavitalea sp. G-6-1-2 TaxID=2728841 RepID=UPI00146A0053|nr:YggS family pyridoxal phosphate-dependent enzyme [Pseudoflavitalea sp. G-6-1-2]NML23399.1 YggS family pyridoxal phosphate-dependent enzyme [Pseudoflavitalea sp. G-6-1-2]
MAVNIAAYNQILAELQPQGVTLVAVSKTKPVEDIQALYDLGQRDFGENYVQELTEKQPQLPADIRWHFIGHLQSNKVKYIAPYVFMIHGVDSAKLLKEIDKQAAKLGRVIPVLLQVFIAREETKFGLDAAELEAILTGDETAGLRNIRIEGLMGMASFTDNTNNIREEFRSLKALHSRWSGHRTHNIELKTLSFGMSSDYAIAIGEGSNLVRIGSLLFGARG